jgi:hypothetical protein
MGMGIDNLRVKNLWRMYIASMTGFHHHTGPVLYTAPRGALTRIHPSHLQQQLQLADISSSIASLDKQSANDANTDSPGQRPEGRDAAVVLKNDVDVVVRDPRGDTVVSLSALPLRLLPRIIDNSFFYSLSQRQGIDGLDVHTGGVGRHYAGGVHADGLGVVGVRRLGAQDAALSLFVCLSVTVSGK